MSRSMLQQLRFSHKISSSVNNSEQKKIDYDIYLNTKVFCHSYIFKLFQYSRFSRFEFSSQEVPMIIRTIKNREQNSKIAITTPLSGEIFPNSMRTCWLYPKRYRIFFPILFMTSYTFEGQIMKMAYQQKQFEIAEDSVHVIAEIMHKKFGSYLQITSCDF